MSHATLGAETSRWAGRTPGSMLLTASTLSGNEVCNRREEKLGSIEEIMLDTESGNIRYAVLAAGGFLGIGDRLYAIPWNALQLDAENERFILDIDSERLKNAPGFDKDDWPNMADPAWADSIRSYYSSTYP
jgi:sporulation protein YlmC with PRC-barrel domain